MFIDYGISRNGNVGESLQNMGISYVIIFRKYPMFFP